MTRTKTTEDQRTDLLDLTTRESPMLDLTPREPRMPLGYSVASLSHETELSKQTIYREIEEGRLRAKRVRGRLVIPAEAVAEWLAEESR